MIPAANDDRLRSMLDVRDPGVDFSARTLRSVRERTTERDLAFDIRASDRGLVSLQPGRGTIEADSRRGRDIAERARTELAEYLSGARSFFTVAVDLSGAAPFQRAVLDAAVAIPFGERRTYTWIAERIGSAKAVRAVGTALGRNPVPIVVPCHRVQRSDGGLGGYAFGLAMKTRLLTLERETFALVGSDTTHIVCRHGCPGEQRIGASHRVAFASVTEAGANGYRPCKRCAPRDGAAENLVDTASEA